jgi:hypothetical protein
MAERMGVPIVLPRISPQPYSRLAFEGFAYAAERGLGQRYTEQIYRAFFVQQRHIGRPEVLTDVAVQLDLDPEDFRAALDSGCYAAAHQRALRRAHELGITVVPTILFNGRRLEGDRTTRHAEAPGVALRVAGSLVGMDDLCGFVLARLADDEQRLRAGELPYLDEAERRGRLRIMRTDDKQGLLLVAGPIQTQEERVPVPFPEKAAFLRAEAGRQRDKAMLGLVASVYDAHPDWREDWRP